jgi:hypothetical protein
MEASSPLRKGHPPYGPMTDHIGRKPYADKPYADFDSHLAFFRDSDHKDHHDEHCANLEVLIPLGEARGR